MIENGAGHVFAAFEILLEEIETEIDERGLEPAASHGFEPVVRRVLA